MPLAFPLPLVRGEAFPASAGFSVRSLPGLLVGGAIEAVLVGVMSMASEGEVGAGSWWETLAPVRMGIGFGRAFGERWSWAKEVRGNDSVAAMAGGRSERWGGEGTICCCYGFIWSGAFIAELIARRGRLPRGEMGRGYKIMAEGYRSGRRLRAAGFAGAGGGREERSCSHADTGGPGGDRGGRREWRWMAGEGKAEVIRGREGEAAKEEEEKNEKEAAVEKDPASLGP